MAGSEHDRRDWETGLPGVGADRSDLLVYSLRHDPWLNARRSVGALVIAFILGAGLTIVAHWLFGPEKILVPTTSLSVFAVIAVPFQLAGALWRWRHGRRAPLHNYHIDTKSVVGYFGLGVAVVAVVLALLHLEIESYQWLLVGPSAALGITLIFGPFYYWTLSW